MADELPSSSQSSYYEAHRILLDDQENLPSPQLLPSSPPKTSSPSRPCSAWEKPKALPTVTPKRFRKFFTPRSSLSAGCRTRSKAGRQLKDITKDGANRRPKELATKDELLKHLLADDAHPPKRRKVSIDIASSPPQSSPLKRMQTAEEQVPLFSEPPSSPTMRAADEDDNVLAIQLGALKPFPKAIGRLGQPGSSRRIMERSFGGYDVLSRAHFRDVDPAVDWKAEVANFVTTPSDVHNFRSGTAVPFCTASCNTNSLIAIGDEEGNIRLIDSAASSEFSTAHLNFRVHHNATMDLAFSSDDFKLATASGDQTARIVDMHTQETLCILSSHTSSVKQIRFNPGDDNVLTTSSRDGTVQIWDLRCSERGSMQTLRPGQRRGMNEDGLLEASVRFSKDTIRVGPTHRSAKGANTRSPNVLNSEDHPVSITAIEHLPNSRGHLLLTASELSASVKLWDLRNASSRRDPVPLSSTPLPESHKKSRNFGISAMALSGDGARLYTLCKDATIYAYSTNHLALGSVPEMSALGGKRRGGFRDSKQGLGPLYGFRHPALRTGTFYLKAAVRKAKGDRSEMLAVGNTDGCPILFPTDERYLARPWTRCEDDLNVNEQTARHSPRSASNSSLPIYTSGSALIRGHTKEVTSLSWTHDGDLVSVSDDFTARCWREDAEKARYLRTCGEGGGLRWGHGWADVEERWDSDEY